MARMVPSKFVLRTLVMISYEVRCRIDEWVVPYQPSSPSERVPAELTRISIFMP